MTSAEPATRKPDAPTAPAKPQPAAPLTDEQLRLECVKQAISAGVDSRYVTEGADRLRDYVKNGIVGNTNAPFGHVG